MYHRNPNFQIAELLSIVEYGETIALSRATSFIVSPYYFSFGETLYLSLIQKLPLNSKPNPNDYLLLTSHLESE